MATFDVKLKSPPSGNVVLTVASDDTTEGSVLPATLTFTEDNWNTYQTVTAIGVDDDEMDGNQVFDVEVDVNDGSTDDATGYKDISSVIISVTNVDNETAGFTISPISGNTSEGLGSAAFVVTLNSKPASDVTIAVDSENTAEGTVSPASLTFTPENWNSNGHIVIVTGVDDNLSDGDKEYTVELGTSVSNDTNYNGLDPADVMVVNTDNENSSNEDTDTGKSSGDGGGCFIESLIP